MNGWEYGDRSFRPAPFPVYAPNRRPALNAAARRLVALLVALALLAPFTVDTGRADSGGIQVALVELDRREPVLLSCDFSLAGFTACPPRLGSFNEDGQFVCSGEVPQGMLYGNLRGTRRVILISYNLGAQSDLDGLLAEIRQRVNQMNDRGNLLKQAKAAMGQPPEDQTGLPGWFWDPEPAPTKSSLFVELAEKIPEGTFSEERVSRRLEARARDTARLKELYYSAQEARIDLLAAQFNLQLVLAQTPGQDVPGMLVLGGSDAARDAMLTELSRMADAWNSRLAELEAQTKRDRSWLRTEKTPRPAKGWEVFSFLPNLLGRAPESDEQPLAANTVPGPLASQLELSYREARLTVMQSEMSALDSGLARLEELSRRVELGVPATGTIRRVALSSRAFGRPSLEDLPGYPAIAQIVGKGEADELFDQLAGEFAGVAAGTGRYPTPGSDPEVLYCLAAAELLTQAQPDYPALKAEEPGSGGEADDRQLSQAYAGFMQFARWCVGSAGYRAETDGLGGT